MGLETPTKLSPDQMAEALLAAGYTMEQIQATTGTYADACYDEEYVELEPEFTRWAPVTVNLYDPRVEKDVAHPLRIISRGDMYQSLPEIYEIARAWGKRERKTAEDVLAGSAPEGFLATLFNRLKGLRASGGKYPTWAVAAYNLIGRFISTPERTITAATFIALSNAQHDELILAFWQVNRQDFLGWLGLVLPDLARMISMLESQAGAILSNFAKIGQRAPENLPGGAESIGKSPSLDP